jgi:SAM-dependent methyltransferase
MRVNPKALPKENWLHFLRQRDLEQVIAATPERLAGPVLEIGCGDGFVTTLLRQRFGQVVPIDIEPRARVDGLSVASADLLPFPDDHFGLVFSSNVLEHIENLTGCFAELERVLRDDGMMIHTMPTPTWKTLQIAFRPLYLLSYKLLPRLTGAPKRAVRAKSEADFASTFLSAGRKQSASYDSDPWQDLPAWKRALVILPPTIHGVAPSHREEMKRFRVQWWLSRFHENGFEVYRTAPLYLHTAYRLLPYRALALRETVSRAGFSSVVAYWVKKQS